MNVALLRVLYAHALARRRASRWAVAPLGRILGDPRLGMAGGSSRCAACCQTAIRSRSTWSASRGRAALGRMLDYAVIVPQCSAVRVVSRELRKPCLLELVRDGNPIYAWPFEQRHVWRTPKMPFAGRVLERVTRAR